MSFNRAFANSKTLQQLTNTLKLSTMAQTASLKLPPESARGMTKFDASKFDKELTVHALEMARENVGAAKKVLAKYVLKMAKVNGVVPSASGDELKKRILLDPDAVKDPQVDFSEKEVELIGKLTGGAPMEQVFSTEKINLTFKVNDAIARSTYQLLIYLLFSQNWTPKELLDFILEDKDKNIPTLSSFAIVGHVMHVNLKDYHLAQKEVIGQILLLYPNCRTVVNKTNSIDNTYRNFQLELLAGEEDYLVTHKELGCTYK